MTAALRFNSSSLGAIRGRETSRPVDEPPVSMLMTATTKAQISIGGMFTLVTASSMLVNAAVLVTTAAKPHIAETVRVMCIDSAAPVLMTSLSFLIISLRFLPPKYFQKRIIESIRVTIMQIFILILTILKSTKRNSG